MPGPIRCAWAGSTADYVDYHDTEWGAPLHDERRLFEMLILEGAQAGLSWLTILRKRDGYRAAFDNFDAAKIACYDHAKADTLAQDGRIVRNRLKIAATIGNARATLELREMGAGLDGYFWTYVEGRPIVNRWRSMDQVPASTPLSEQISKDLKKRGFRFVGPTIVYAFMQSIGMVNGNLVVTQASRGFGRLVADGLALGRAVVAEFEMADPAQMSALHPKLTVSGPTSFLLGVATSRHSMQAAYTCFY
jgi:DNA-3-methyladenine glycosylase I